MTYDAYVYPIGYDPKLIKNPGYLIEPSSKPVPPAYQQAQSCPLYPNTLVGHLYGLLTNMEQSTGTGDGLENILADRRTMLRSKMELLLLQLQQRKAINQTFNEYLEQEHCNLSTMLFGMGAAGYYVENRTRQRLEKFRFDLEKERRQEAVSYFRDTNLLNKELRETLIQYLEERQKAGLLADWEDKP